MVVATFSPAPAAGLDLHTCSQMPTAHAALYFLGHATLLSCTVCTPGSEPDAPAGGWEHVVLGAHCAVGLSDDEADSAVARARSSARGSVVIEAAGPLLCAALRQRAADVVALGHEQAAQLPVPDGEDAPRWLRRQGVRLALCATGDGGVVLEGDAGRFEARLPARATLNQDGRLMAAGYVAGVLRGMGLVDQLKLAAACAWATPGSGEVSPLAIGRAFRSVSATGR